MIKAVIMIKYFDYAATTPLDPEAYELLLNSFKSDFANPSSLHELGNAQKETLLEIKSKFKSLIGAKEQDKLVFLSSATEANNTINFGIKLTESDVVMYSKADHSSLTGSLEKAKEKIGFRTIEITHYKNGQINTEKLLSDISEHSNNLKYIALTSVNNQTGCILDITKLSKEIKLLTKAHIHIDAVQHFGKIPLFKLDYIDSMSLSAHKIYGPKGIGALFMKNGSKIDPLMYGGGQEENFRPGTENISLIKAFYFVANKEIKNLKNNFEVASKNKALLLELLENKIPNLNNIFENTSPYIHAFIWPGISSDIVLRHLERKNIYISSTSACSSKIKGFNPSLKAIGIEEVNHKNFLRISLSHNSSSLEIEDLVNNLDETFKELKKYTR